ncbi:hypothetical protein FF38_11893 [Lucilia cuprina]|uniref:EB domain-containing protein n=1 Tax=Lucilia cuprina TaxID=7375 RepID=A0A0L0BYH6_LUCCU|nr:hypothetical protein CVS40_0194 [Lucilia cuprina]KNC25031.1 hypothetical protein FF38_11893 [Lucilia cuprina]
MKSEKFAIFLAIILNCVNLIQSDELLELNCINETQCKQFQHSGIKSACIEEQCHCSSSNGDNVKCQPLNHKVNNIIGGPCPCQQPNAECDTQQDVCYCASNFMPSSDKRRCIAKMVALGEKCELDSQCQKVDFNAICHESSKQCICMDQFINNEGKCTSIVGNKSFCSNDEQCTEKYGENTQCSNITQHCICKPEHFASIDNARCLKISKYLEACTENIQCMGTMGPGGKCTENVCQCSEKYFVEEKKTEKDVVETVCTAVVERGHYCRIDEDCYQRQLNESQQSMDCIYGECNCKMGFNSYNDGDCIEGSGGATIKTLMSLNLILLPLYIFVNSYF